MVVAAWTGTAPMITQSQKQVHVIGVLKGQTTGRERKTVNAAACVYVCMCVHTMLQRRFLQQMSVRSTAFVRPASFDSPVT